MLGSSRDGAALVPTEAPHADILLAARRAQRREIIRFGRELCVRSAPALVRRRRRGRARRRPISSAGSIALSRRRAGRALGAQFAGGACRRRRRRRRSGMPPPHALGTCAPPMGAAAKPSACNARSARSCLWMIPTTPTPLRSPPRLETLGETPGRRAPHRRAWATCWNLGRTSAPTMRALPRRLKRRGVDLVFAAGPRMRALMGGASAVPPRRLCRNVRRADSDDRECSARRGRCFGERLERFEDERVVEALSQLAAVLGGRHTCSIAPDAAGRSVPAVQPVQLHHVPHRRRDGHGDDLRVR